MAFWLLCLSPGAGGHVGTGQYGKLRWTVASALWLSVSTSPPCGKASPVSSGNWASFTQRCTGFSWNWSTPRLRLSLWRRPGPSWHPIPLTRRSLGKAHVFFCGPVSFMPRLFVGRRETLFFYYWIWVWEWNQSTGKQGWTKERSQVPVILFEPLHQSQLNWPLRFHYMNQ